MPAFSDEVSWITGAGSGIGRACAIAFARAGARVALTGRRVEALEETARIVRAFGATAFVAPTDVTRAEAVGQAHAEIVAALGDPLVLVNSAGGNARRRHWGQLSPADASAVIDLDLKSVFYATLAVLPAMRARGDGRIVHIASQAGVSLQTVSGPSYSAAKSGVVAMSASLNAEEGIHGIEHLPVARRGQNPDPRHTPLAAEHGRARADAATRGRRRGRAVLRDAAEARLRDGNGAAADRRPAFARGGAGDRGDCGGGAVAGASPRFLRRSSRLLAIER